MDRLAIDDRLVELLVVGVVTDFSFAMIFLGFCLANDRVMRNYFSFIM